MILGTSLESLFPREAALARGLKKFRSTQPCPKGHIGERWTKSGRCVICCPHKTKKTKWEKARAHNRARQQRLVTIPAYKFIEVMRVRILAVLKGKDKSARSVELLGCDPAWFIAEVAPGLLVEASAKWGFDMTLANHGVLWEWDHLVPLSSFDMADPEQQRRAFNWRNLRPLPVRINRSKGAKSADTFVPPEHIVERPVSHARGSITKRGVSSWRLSYELPRGPDGKRRTVKVTFRGTYFEAVARLAELVPEI